MGRFDDLLRAPVIVEAKDGKGNAYSTLHEIAAWLLEEGDILNVFHWNAKSNTKHELLAEAYELCRDTGDKLAETYVAKTGKAVHPSRISAKGIEWDPSDDTVLKRLHSIQDDMAGAVEKNPKFGEGVKNIFADFDEAMTVIIYKYSRFEA